MNRNLAEEMAKLLEEAANSLRSVPEDVAERLQIRHYLPDELEGSAGMLREHFQEKLG